MSASHPLRFSLRTLLLAVVAVSVGTAAMVSSSKWWQATAMTTSVVMLIAAILLVAYRSGSSRAYWSGYAVSSGMYLFLLFLGSDDTLPGMLVNLLADVIHAAPNPTSSMSVTSYPTTLPSQPAYGVSPYSPAIPTLAPVPDPTGNVGPEPKDGSQPKNEPTPEGACTSPAEWSNPGCGDSDDPPQPQPADDLGAAPSFSTGPVIQAYTTPANQPPATVIYSSGATMAPTYAPIANVSTYDDVVDRRQRCVAIGHCLWSILFGMAGGSFAAWLHATRKSPPQAGVDSPTPEKVVS